MSGVEKAKRDRVAKACATCRRKKIKCNGQTPCDHCSHLNTPCEYPTNKPRKSRSKTSSELVQTRLDRLEALMHKIAQKVGNIDPQSIPSPDSANQIGGDDNSVSETSSPASDYKDSADDIRENGNRVFEASREASQAIRSQSPEKQPRHAFFQQSRSIIHQTIDRDSPASKNTSCLLQYKGMHSGLVLIFSNQGIEWIKSKLKPEDHKIVAPLHTLFFYFNVWKQHFQSVWMELKSYPEADIRKLKEGVYPHDRQLTFELLRHFTKVAMAGFICEAEEAEVLFTKFYENKTAPPNKKYKFSSSELMVMNLCLAISISVAIDSKSGSAYSPGFESCPKIDAMTVDQLTALQEEMFLNSLYYFHTISVVSEGLITIQALLLLVTHLETSWVITDVNYSFVSMASRYAQELGLHRYETSSNLPDEEMQKRARIWAAVQCYDVEISHRTGKPPSVNMVDVSTLTPMDPLFIPALRTREEVAILQEACGGKKYPLDAIYLQYHHYKLSQLRAFSYFQLFSATVKYDSLKGIQEIVSSLNHELSSFSNEIREEFRPRYYYDAKFNPHLMHTASEDSGIGDCLLSLHLAFFYQIMTINKVPSQIDPNEGHSPPYENACYRKAALDSARTILHITLGMSKRATPFFLLNWNSFYIFVSAMNLLSNCLNHFDDSDCYKDLSLLIDVSMDFFSYFSIQVRQPETKLFYLRLHLFDILIRIVLRIAVKVYEERNNISIMGSNPVLKDHLESVEKEFPQFYSKAHDATDLLRMMNSLSGGAQRSAFGSPASTPQLPRPSSQNSNTMPGPERVSSPRKNDPTLFDILHPVDFASSRDTDRRDYTIDDDFLLAAANQDFSALPNFFFDNGL